MGGEGGSRGSGGGGGSGRGSGLVGEEGSRIGRWG